MNAPFLATGTAVRAAELADAELCRRIDAFVAAHPDGEIFHRPAWSRAVERGCGQRAHFLVAEDPDGGLAGCLPLTHVRSFLFGDALVSAGFATGGGILARDQTAAASLAEAGWALARSLGCGSLELRGGALPEGWRRREGVYAGFSRDLPADPDALLASIPRKQRAEVRRALGFELDVETGRDPALVRAFTRVFGESVRNLGTPVLPARLFEAMVEEFGEDCDILLVSRDGEPLSGFFNFYFGDTAYGYWGGGTGEARRWRANDLVYHAFMAHAIGRGFRRADLGRSKVGTGAWERKRIWGFDERPLVYSERTAAGKAGRDINPLSPRYRLQVELWQKLPLVLANRLGPLISRGLG